jgi:outer membrane protein OmpA-like peptidoglycan-associated protein
MPMLQQVSLPTPGVLPAAARCPRVGRRRQRLASRRQGWVGAAVATLLAAIVPSALAAGEGEAKQPNWQVPGEIQQPRGTWQTPGEIQKAGEIQRVEEECRRRLVVAADALFAFDSADLSPQAAVTLEQLGPQLADAKGKVTVEGHTDAKGGDDYNRVLSERRAKAVRDWLVAKGMAPAGTPIVGFGESKPVASNTQADGSDNPSGRERNRRVEVVVETCGNG